MGGTIDDIDFANAIAKYNMPFGGGRGSLGTITGTKMNTYEKTVIKNFMNIEYGPGASIDQLITAYGYFGTVIDRVKAGGYDVPKDLQTAFDSCERDLQEKITDNRKARLEGLKRERDALASAEEKRQKIDDEIAKLEELVK